MVRQSRWNLAQNFNILAAENNPIAHFIPPTPGGRRLHFRIPFWKDKKTLVDVSEWLQSGVSLLRNRIYANSKLTALVHRDLVSGLDMMPLLENMAHLKHIHRLLKKVERDLMEGKPQVQTSARPTQRRIPDTVKRKHSFCKTDAGVLNGPCSPDAIKYLIDGIKSQAEAITKPIT